MHSDVAILSKPCIWREALRIVNEEGFRAFWKGNLVTIAHRLPYSSVNFYSYEKYKNVSNFIQECSLYSYIGLRVFDMFSLIPSDFKINTGA